MTGPVPPPSTAPPLNGMPGVAGQNNTGNNPVANNTQNSTSPQSTIGFNPFAPLQMKTLVYSPDVRVVIEDSSGTQYDVSKDIIRGQVIRKENSVSTLFITLANKPTRSGGPPRYNGLFDRMDKIICYMKGPRGWVTVFTGYLDSVPFSQMYPGMVEIQASCTLKRLLHTWWNPALPASQTFFSQYGYATGMHGVLGSTQSHPSDSGLGNMLADILNKVGGWQAQDILIQDFPMKFLTFLEANYAQIESKNQQPVQAFRHLLLGDDTRGGVGSAAGKYQSPAGVNAGLPGPTGTSAPFYLQEIIAATDIRTMGPSVQDLANSNDLMQIGQSGAGSDRQSESAWTQLAKGPGATWQSNARSNDAAILAVACALEESGMRNLANPNVPASMSIVPNDGPGTDHNSVGLFQQQPDQGWGTVADAMNPRVAAGMFLDRLATLGDWRNMDPATAIALVQNGPPASAYQAFIAQATQTVQAYRQSQGVYGAGSSTVVPGGAGLGMGGAENLPALTNAVTTAPAGGGPASPVAIPGAPVPDASGAINFALAHVSAPYHWGGHGPDTFDCSGFVSAAYASIGVQVPPLTYSIAQMPGRVSAAQISPGDLVVVPDQSHVVMYIGNGMIVEQSGPEGTPGRVAPNYVNLDASTIIHVANASGNPGAAFNPAAVSNTGTPTGASGYTGSATSAGAGAGSEQIARNLFSYMFTPMMFADSVADLFTGEKAFIDGQPLIQMVQAICKAGLRSFQSAPTGEFVAYYPDWFGLDGKPAVLNMEDIECKDVRVTYSDIPLTTHVYIAGDFTMMGESQGEYGWLETCGVVTIEDQWLYKRLTSISPNATKNLDSTAFMNRFGVRPYKEEYVIAKDHALEFLIAAQIFMLKWAEQYQTTVQFTFMPELFPGMRINLVGHNLQVYVTQVTHSFDFESGFSTSAEIMAPSAGNAAENVETTNNTTVGATANPTGQSVFMGG